MDEGRSSGFGCSARMGKALGIGERFSRTSSARGLKGADLSLRCSSRVGGDDQEDLSRSGVNLCVLQAVRGALNKVRKKNRDALAKALKKIYWAET